MADTTPSTLARRFIVEQAAEAQRQVTRLSAALRDLEARCETTRRRLDEAEAVRDAWVNERDAD
jgi:hypothetical protein